MSDYAIVTDSLSSLPQELIDRFQIIVVPQVLIWGEEEFLDGVNITPTEFYTRLRTDPVMPTTSQATVASFQSVFEPLASQGKEILTIVGSSKLTATLNSAEQAKGLFPDARIEILDSMGVAMALGFQALAVARAAAAGASLRECQDLAEAVRPNTGTML